MDQERTYSSFIQSLSKVPLDRRCSGCWWYLPDPRYPASAFTVPTHTPLLPTPNAHSCPSLDLLPHERGVPWGVSTPPIPQPMTAGYKDTATGLLTSRGQPGSAAIISQSPALSNQDTSASSWDPRRLCPFLFSYIPLVCVSPESPFSISHMLLNPYFQLCFWKTPPETRRALQSERDDEQDTHYIKDRGEQGGSQRKR